MLRKLVGFSRRTPKPVAASKSTPLHSGALLMVLTGAGVSAESGIPVCQVADGLGEAWDADALGTLGGFAADPERFAAYYDVRRAALAAAKPNAAHFALAELERQWPGDFLLVTSNVDSLHEAAGSRNILHLHGKLSDIRCLECGSVTPDARAKLVQHRCTGCGYLGPHRPHVVLSGERPFHLDVAFAATDRCEVFLAAGCGGAFRPASLIPKLAWRNHKRHPRIGLRPCQVVEINLRPTGNPAFTQVIQGSAATEVPPWVAATLAAGPSGQPLAPPEDYGF